MYDDDEFEDELEYGIDFEEHHETRDNHHDHPAHGDRSLAEEIAFRTLWWDVTDNEEEEDDSKKRRKRASSYSDNYDDDWDEDDDEDDDWDDEDDDDDFADETEDEDDDFDDDDFADMFEDGKYLVDLDGYVYDRHYERVIWHGDYLRLERNYDGVRSRDGDEVAFAYDGPFRVNALGYALSDMGNRITDTKRFEAVRWILKRK